MNDIAIFNFMHSDLGLQRNNIMVFALIFTASEMGDSYVEISYKDFCNILTISKPTAIKAVRFLMDKDLIHRKKVVRHNGFSFVYTVKRNKIERFLNDLF